MNDTRLILIDGLTGVGKSTTAQRLWLCLERAGTAARWIYEHDLSHPVWPAGDMQRIVARGAVPRNLMHRSLPRRWARLARNSQRGQVRTILEGSLLQSTIGLLLAMNVPEPDIVACLVACEQALAPARPVLFWLQHGDTAGSLRATLDDRRSDGYEQALITLLAGTPYGRAHHVASFDALVAFYERWTGVAKAACRQFTMPVIVVPAVDWRQREQQIAAALGCPGLEPPPPHIEAPARFIGRYRDLLSQDCLAIAGDETGLYMDDARRTRLLPAGGASFHVAGLGVEMRFSDERAGCFRRVGLHGNLPHLSPAWQRVDNEEGVTSPANVASPLCRIPTGDGRPGPAWGRS